MAAQPIRRPVRDADLIVIALVMTLMLLGTGTLAAQEPGGADPPPEPPKKRQFVIQMDDGVCIVGTPQLRTLKMHSPRAGRIETPVEEIRSVEFDREDRAARVTFANGDALHATLDLTSLAVETFVGPLSIPMERIRRISTNQAARLGDAHTLRNPGNGHLYAFVEKRLSWKQAKRYAERSVLNGMQGHLATLTSAEENRWVYENMPPTWRKEGEAWLGGYQSGGPEPDGGWHWITGEPWNWTNWHAGEPNDGGEDHLEFAGDEGWGGEWNDANGAGRIWLIVEFEPSDAPLPTRYQVELDDGSRVVGIPFPDASLPFHSELFGDISAPFRQLSRIEFTEGRDTVKIYSRNGDVLPVAFKLAELELKTVFGKVAIPLDHVESVSAYFPVRDLPDPTDNEVPHVLPPGWGGHFRK